MNDEIKKFASSPEIFDRCMEIGKMFGLHVDQIGYLDAEIRDIFDGIKKSSDFTSNIIKRLEIQKDLADKIVVEVNKRIIDSLKTKLKEEGSKNDLSELEKAGGFNVEKEETHNGSEDVSASDRDEILSGLENPVPSKEERRPIPKEDFKEPLVDQLLSSAQVRVEEKIEHKVADAPVNLPTDNTARVPQPEKPQVSDEKTKVESQKPKIEDQKPKTSVPVPPRKPGVDPYRESF